MKFSDEFLPLPEDGMPLAGAKTAIDAMRGTPFVNRATGIVARLSSSAKGKLVSNKATGKSTSNGFSREQHNAMAANVGRLFEMSAFASSRPDKEGDANVISIKRFVARVSFGKRRASAWITVKESKQFGHHIYSVEAIKLEALDRKVEVACASTPHASSAPTVKRIPFWQRAVKWARSRFAKHTHLRRFGGAEVSKQTMAIVGVMLAPLAVMADPLPDGGPYTETVDGITWMFMVNGGNASIGCNRTGRASPRSITGDIAIPSALGGCPVMSIDAHAFTLHSGLTSITISEGITNIGAYAFESCYGLISVAIPSSVTSIGEQAFSGCSGMKSFEVDEDNPRYKTENHLLLTKDGKTLVAGVNGDVTIPASVTSIKDYAFYRCSGLKSVTMEGDAPMCGDGIFEGTPADMVVHVKGSSAGWTQWNGRVIKFDADGGTSSSTVNMNLTITNIVVHYIQTSEMSPMAAPITKDVGIVNVMTEVKGGNVSIPESWVTNYPAFKATFGSDFSKALIAETKKHDAGGKPMFVWQDFVAGTDPTDENDVFKASVTMVGGKPVVSYTPQLSEVEKAKRKYTTWGKVKLQDSDWVEIPSGSEDDYNFFKVTVEMR